jgi:hypothetical protein
MTRALKTLSGVLAVSLAASAFLITDGCGGSKPTASSAPPALTLPASPRSIDASSASAQSVSANNAADLSKAQSEDDFEGKSTARDLDTGQNGGAAPTAPLDYAALGAELQQLGVNPQDQKTFYQLAVKATLDSTDYTFPITVSLSTDKSVVWVLCNLVQADKNGTPPADTLMALLSANNQMGISSFALADNHMLMLQAPFTNLGVTSQVMGANLKSFFANLKATQPVWKTLFPAANSGGGSGGGGGGGNPFQ